MANRQTLDTAKITHIVFDAVGTLIHPAEPVAVSYQRIGAKFGSQLTLKQVQNRFPDAFSKFYRHRLVSSDAAERECWRKIVTTVLDDVRNPDECFMALFRHFALSASWRIYADVASSTETLVRNGFELSLASNFDSRLHSICERAPALSSIRHRILSIDAGYKKPDATFFGHVAKVLDADPGQLLMVGDDFQADIRGATQAGFHAVWLNRKSKIRPSSINNVPEIVTLHDLIDLLPQQY